jgi:ATP-dependent DNA helicase RecG
MDQTALTSLLDQLIAHWEDEVVEFKRGKDSYSASDLGKYLSALANEANLRGKDRAWIVFGVDDKTRKVVGTTYKENPEQLQATKKQVLDGTGSITFRNIHEMLHPDGRVILFEVPAAPRGMPITSNGHAYGRAGESLVALPQDKLDDIRNQTIATDWTAQVVAEATIDDLDPVAVATARERFVEKHGPRITPAEVAGWSDSTFLDRAKVTQSGAITRTALLLLGKKEAAWRLSPHPAEITWSLRGKSRPTSISTRRSCSPRPLSMPASVMCRFASCRRTSCWHTKFPSTTRAWFWRRCTIALPIRTMLGTAALLSPNIWID